MTTRRSARARLKALLPRRAIRGYHRLRGDRSGDWAWSADWPRSAGSWDHPSIGEVQEAGWSTFAAAVRAPNVLAVSAETAAMGSPDASVQNTYLAYAYALARAARGRTTVSVLDWGGGLGQYHVLGRELFPDLEISYTVKELADLARRGRRLSPELRFVDNPDNLEPHDLVFASSSLHYSQHWRELLAVLARLSKEWLYITRQPIVTAVADFVVIQDATAHGYRARYPGWVLNRHNLVGAVEREGFTLERELLIDERLPVLDAPELPEYRGFLFCRT